MTTIKSTHNVQHADKEAQQSEQGVAVDKCSGCSYAGLTQQACDHHPLSAKAICKWQNEHGSNHRPHHEDCG